MPLRENVEVGWVVVEEELAIEWSVDEGANDEVEAAAGGGETVLSVWAMEAAMVVTAGQLAESEMRDGG